MQKYLIWVLCVFPDSHCLATTLSKYRLLAGCFDKKNLVAQQEGTQVVCGTNDRDVSSGISSECPLQFLRITTCLFQHSALSSYFLQLNLH